MRTESCSSRPSPVPRPRSATARARPDEIGQPAKQCGNERDWLVAAGDQNAVSPGPLPSETLRK